MTLTIDIQPDLEERLTTRPEAAGQTLETCIEQLLRRESDAPEPAKAMTPAERAAAFDAWTKSFPPDLPVLTLEDVSRENLYRRDDEIDYRSHRSA